jgi:hypothetical protein
MKTITYAFDKDGLWASRVYSEIAFPMLDYSGIGRGGRSTDPNTGEEGAFEYPIGDFRGPVRHHLEKLPVFDFANDWKDLTWTRKVPAEVKNHHRQFWGLKPLRQTRSTK